MSAERTRIERGGGPADQAIAGIARNRRLNAEPAAFPSAKRTYTSLSVEDPHRVRLKRFCSGLKVFALRCRFLICIPVHGIDLRQISKIAPGFVIAALLVFPAVPCDAAPVCLFGGVRCFIACNHPPKLTLATEQFPLKAEPYDEITGFDQWSALFTTPLGKCLGINGWRRYRFRVQATGMVIQAARSWDGLRTIDLQLEEINGKHPDCPGKRCFIRAEVVRRAWKHLDHIPVEGDRVRIAGELHWDGHGFLEIHPAHKTDIENLGSMVGRPN